MRKNAKIFVATSSLIVASLLMFKIVSAFFTSSLNFKAFYKDQVKAKKENNVIFTIEDEKTFIYAENTSNYLSIYKFTADNLEPIRLLYVDDYNIKNDYGFDFANKNGTYYLSYDNKILVYNYKANTYQIVDYPIHDKFVYGCDGTLYTFDGYNLSSYTDNNTNIQLFDNKVEAKEIYFLNNDYLLFVFTDSIKLVKCTEHTSFSYEFTKYNDFVVDYNRLVISYFDDDKQIIVDSSFDISFTTKEYKIDRIDYTKMVYKDNNVFFINGNKMYKYTLNDKIMKEKYTMSGYSSYSYNLENIIIANADTFYLLLTKKEKENDNDVYYHYLYRKK